MKKSALIFLLAIPMNLLGQKIKSATQRKTFAGRDGVFMNYVVELKIPASRTIEIDSVKTIADTVQVQFSFIKDARKISFGFPLAQPEKCHTCPNIVPQLVNTTKGVIIYGRNGEKQFSIRVKKFKVLSGIKSL
jgi:hypothetical protein